MANIDINKINLNVISTVKPTNSKLSLKINRNKSTDKTQPGTTQKIKIKKDQSGPIKAGKIILKKADM